MGQRGPTKTIIQEIVRKLVAEYAPQKVILFGSYAYGEPLETSDIDLLIVKETDKRAIERWDGGEASAERP